MSSINYLLIQKEALQSYGKNYNFLNLLGIILTAIPLLIAFATNVTDSNRIFYFLSAIPLLLLLVLFYFYYYKISLKATESKLSLHSFKFHYNTFAHFIVNQALVAITVTIASIPVILAGLVFGIALYNRILPYDKYNLSFDDFRAALSGVYVYFYAFLIIFFINLPFIFYAVLRVGFSGFYVLKNDSSSIEAIKENLADTQKVDLVNAFTALLVFLIYDMIIAVSLIWVVNIIAQGTIKTQSAQISLIILPLILIPIFGVQLATMYKQLSERNQIV